MKILLIEEEFNKHKGISRYVVELAENMSRDKSNEVHLLTVHYDYEIPNIVVHKRPPCRIGGFVGVLFGRVLNSFYALTIRNKFSIDIVHSQSSESLVCDVITMHSCHKAGVRQWNNISKQELSFSRYLIKKTLRFLNPYNILTIFIEGRLLKTTRKVLVISKMVEKEVFENYNGVDIGKIEVIYHGVDSDFFKPDDNNRSLIRSSLGLEENNFVISFCGYEFKRKGLHYLIESLPLLNKKTKLLVIGEDNEKIYKLLASKLGVLNDVMFIGAVSKNLNAYLNASDVFVFPTTHEAFGLVITEAMACGLPVVFSKIAGASEIIRDGYDAMLLNDPTNVGEISNKVNQLIMDKSLLKKIGDNARKTAINYKWSEVANKTLNVYIDILKNK